MDPESHGQASVFALAVAVVVLLAALWAGFAMDRSGVQGSSEPVPRGPAGPDPRVEADALCSQLEQERAIERVFSANVVFHRDAADEAPPVEPRTPVGVDSLAGALDGDAILLTWKATGDEPAAAWVVERLSEAGEVTGRTELSADARSHRDAPLDALKGHRAYRVAATLEDGAVADAEEVEVNYRVEVRIEYRGSASDGRAEFRVRAGEREPALFAVLPGGEIGEARDGMDWRTGWVFAGIRGSRKAVEGTAEVPVFGPDGKLEKDAETGEVVTELRVLPVPELTEGAVVLPPDAPDEGTLAASVGGLTGSVGAPTGSVRGWTGEV